MPSPPLRPCVFLDRDGVINEAPPAGQYILRWEEFRWIDTITDWIRLFRVLGYLVIVVTNQRCVAKGLLSLAELNALHERMQQELARRGAPLDAVYACPDEDSPCRKPRPGMVEQAVRDFGIDLSRSLLIGDTDNDRQLAATCGLPFICVDQGRIVEIVPRPAEPDALGG